MPAHDFFQKLEREYPLKIRADIIIQAICDYTCKPVDEIADKFVAIIFYSQGNSEISQLTIFGNQEEGILIEANIEQFREHIAPYKTPLIEIINNNKLVELNFSFRKSEIIKLLKKEKSSDILKTRADDNPIFSSELPEYLKPYCAMSSFDFHDCFCLLYGGKYLDIHQNNRYLQQDVLYEPTRKLLMDAINNKQLPNSDIDFYDNLIIDRVDIEKWAKYYGYNWILPDYIPFNPNLENTKDEINNLKKALNEEKDKFRSAQCLISQLNQKLKEATEKNNKLEADLIFSTSEINQIIGELKNKSAEIEALKEQLVNMPASAEIPKGEILVLPEGIDEKVKALFEITCIAYREFWTTCDHEDINTVPNSDDITSWLREKELINTQLTKDEAFVIQKILRPDHLKTKTGGKNINKAKKKQKN